MFCANKMPSKNMIVTTLFPVNEIGFSCIQHQGNPQRNFTIVSAGCPMANESCCSLPFSSPLSPSFPLSITSSPWCELQHLWLLETVLFCTTCFLFTILCQSFLHLCFVLCNVDLQLKVLLFQFPNVFVICRGFHWGLHSHLFSGLLQPIFGPLLRPLPTFPKHTLVHKRLIEVQCHWSIGLNCIWHCVMEVVAHIATHFTLWERRNVLHESFWLFWTTQFHCGGNGGSS